jgi:hypothetical protein
MEKQNNAWELHRNMDRQLMSEEDTFLWLSKGDLKSETESEIVAAQDQALNVKYYATKILNTETDSKRKLCQQFDETIDHISACPILAKERYVKWHDSECTTALQHMQGNRGTNGQKTLVLACTKISRNKSRR